VKDKERKREDNIASKKFQIHVNDTRNILIQLKPCEFRLNGRESIANTVKK